MIDRELKKIIHSKISNGSFLKNDRIYKTLVVKDYPTLHQQFKGHFLGQSRNAITKRIKEPLL